MTTEQKPDALPVVAWIDDWEEEDPEEPVCARCGGDGMDPQNDYLLECPECQGRQQP